MFVKGVITALITPLNSDGSLCAECLKDLIEFQSRSGVQGLYLTGTAGEGVILPVEVRAKVFEKALEFAGKNMYLLPHVGGANVDSVIELAKRARDTGYREVSVIAPIFHKPSRKGLVNYFELISSKADVSVIMYNNPNRQGYNVTPDDFQALVEAVPAIKGIKDTSRDVSQLLELVTRFGNKYFIAGGGDDLLFYTFFIGAHAHVCALSNVVPEAAVRIYRSVVEGKFKEALEVQYKISLLRRLIGKMTPEAQEGLRELAKLRGLKPGYPPPQMFYEFDPKLVEEARKLIFEVILRD